MAYHGDRNSSRGVVRGGTRGSGRGASRGGRGRAFRGGASSVPSGRGRGGSRGRGKPIFDSARLAEQKVKDQENEDTSSIVESEDQELESDAVSDDESDDGSTEIINPYNALLKVLAVNADSGPPAKRRKLESSMVSHAQTNEGEDMVEDDNDIDRVEEEGVEDDEDGGMTIGGLLNDEGDDEDVIDSSDPFETHFADPNDNALATKLASLQENKWAQAAQSSNIGRSVTVTPADGTTPNLPPPIARLTQLKLKQKLIPAAEEQMPILNDLEKTIAPMIFAYQDVFYGQRSTKNAESLRKLACLHAINHIYKTRDRVIKNNAKLAKEENNEDLDLRDQGFTRPKVLMLLPTRESCVRMINTITSICQPEQQENRKRFDDSYVDKEERFSEDKTDDFRELFSGNDDDMFRLGMKFTRRTVKYFSQFYNSDIIFASPLGLRMAIGTEESKKIDSDFLSSIEIVIVDQADALLMQNWEHVEFIFEHLNLQPKEAHNCDFSRVRNWYLDNKACYFRQTIALSAYNTPDLNTLFFNNSKNWTGKTRILPTYQGALQELGMRVKQTFSKLQSPSHITDPDTRFAYFTTAIIPTLTRHHTDASGTLLFIPSYLDFIRVRNYLSTSSATETLSFGSISEYTSVKEVARARSHFLSGRHSVLLYTERAHHFRRYALRGVRKVIMYGLPDNPIFYKEIVAGYLGRSVREGLIEGTPSTRAVFSKWDYFKLERIVGNDRVGKMIRETQSDTFDFL